MAPSIMSPTPSRVEAPFFSKRLPKSRRVSGINDSDSVSTLGISQSVHSSRVTSRKYNAFSTTDLSAVVSSLHRNSGEQLGVNVTSRLLTTTHATILEWIRSQRMGLLPPEGSDYDKVLAWAQLFVERLHQFDLAIERFAEDSNLAAQLSYGYCALLLELGRDNARALMVSFGFFYSISMPLMSLLERTELFSVAQEIQEQLTLALSDLVTVVASVATQFHKAISGMTGASLSVNIYRTFAGQIRTFSQRCERIAESMWRHQLLRENLEGEQVSELKAIRSWLGPADPAVTALEDSRSSLAHDREELTCLWVGPYLSRFLKGQKKHLSIIGAPGSGKTVLASVIVDHLQHPHGGVSYQTLFIPINARIPAQTSSHAVAKSILYQLFDRRIGNVRLFRILRDAFHRTRVAADQQSHDDILWTAVEQSLGAALRGAKDLVVVVDGVDEASSSEEKLLEQLRTATSNAAHTKLITLSSKAGPTAADQARVRITDDLILDDIAAVVRRGVVSNSAFAQLPEIEQETIVERVAQASNGSFLWAKLTTKRIREEQDIDGLLKTVDGLVSGQTTITSHVLHILQASDVTPEAKLMLLWLSTASRPLHVNELSALASIDTKTQALSDAPLNPLHILKPLNALVFLHDDYFCLRHGLIRAATLDVFAKGKLIPAIKDRHYDLMARLLTYIKVTVTGTHEPSSVLSLDQYDRDALLDKHPLLGFALHYWVLHFRGTSSYVKDGEIAATKGLSKILSSITTVVLLYRSIWENISPPELLAYQISITTAYRQVLTVESHATLQSIISLAQLYRQVGRIKDATVLYHEATILSQKILTSRHIVTMQLAQVFLEITSEQIASSRTTLMVQREEVLLLLVEHLKIHHGTNSEEVISVLKQLVGHYELVKDHEKAQGILVTIQAIHSSEYGRASANGASGSLSVSLVGRGAKGGFESGVDIFRLDVVEEDELIQSTGSYDVLALIRLAEGYLAEGKTELAERTYIELWQRVTQESRTQSSTELGESKMRIIIAYATFLQSQKRTTEASSVLSSFWQDYEQRTRTVSESSVTFLQQIAEVMTVVGLSSTALSVFKQCSQYYESTRSTQTSIYQEIQESIQTTSKEVMQSVTRSSGSFVAESTLEEMVIEASSSSTTSLHQEFYSTTETLTTLYISQRRWQQATRLIKKVLLNLWPALFTADRQDVTLPDKHGETSVTLAVRLADCYHSRRRLAKEQDIRVRVYYALRSGRALGDALREESVTKLLRLLKSTSQTEVIISIHQELLNDYSKQHGPDHPTVIQTLLTLAKLTRPRPIFLDYYRQFIQALNKDGQDCHPDTLEPLYIVSTELWNQGRHSEALHHTTVLFTAFKGQPKVSPKFQDRGFVQEVFTRYIDCLRAVRSEYSVIYRATMDYRETCKTTFGVAESITLQATFTLAKLCQESRQHEVEAISLYEELLKSKSEALDLQEISATLEALYEEQAATISAAAESNSVSSTRVEQAVKVLRKRVTSLRETYGWAHEESLVKTKEIVELHAKHGKFDLVVRELQESTVKILSSETSTEQLSAAATVIASSYIRHNQTQVVTELAEEVYRQVIVKDTRNVKSSKFDLSTKSRQSLMFLAQLESHLRGQSSTVNQILASLTTELVYFEHFQHILQTKTSTLHAVVSSTARLHAFLLANSRQMIASQVFQEFSSYFLAREGKRTGLTGSAQTHLLTKLLLEYFSTYQSHDFTRSVGIASNMRVLELIASQNHDEASDLALATLKYISAQDAYRTPAMLKLILSLALNLSSGGFPPSSSPQRKKTLDTSATIIQSVLAVLGDLKINIAQIGLDNINTLISVLGAQQNYQTLASVLTGLWTTRAAQRDWSPAITFSLGRLVIMAYYFTGDVPAAVRLAEDIVYNCRCVHGAQHPSTLDMSALLSQLYVELGQRYQAQKTGQELAKRYYKRAAAIHENILRVFSDPDADDFEPNLDESIMSVNGAGSGLGLGFDSVLVDNPVAVGEQIRRHFRLLKLAVQRLGDWPKEYGEYERLNADLVREFGAELEGVEGVEKWDLKAFGAGKAEGGEDRVDAGFRAWYLGRVDGAVEEQDVEEQEEEEEEL